MTTKHTHGPWEIGSEGFDEGYANIWQSPGEGKGEYIIGTVVTEEVGEDEAMANARLIASAPDLIHACESILLNLPSQRLNPDQWECLVRNTRSILERAIAKATEQS